MSGTDSEDVAQPTLISDSLLSWFPFGVVLFLLPTSIYLANQIDLDYATTVLIPFVALALLSLALIFLAYAARPSWRSLAIPLFLAGLFIYVSDVLAPIEWGIMEGSEEVKESWTSTALQIGLVAILFAVWRFVSAAIIRQVAIILVMVSVGWQTVAVTHALVMTPDAETSPGRVATAQGNRPNVYHLVLDGYSSPSFMGAAKQIDLLNQLNGFHFFPRNLSNYDVTDASVPSFMTGKLFSGGSFKEFQAAARTGGLRKTLQAAGYRISNYTPDQSRFWGFEGADYTYTSREAGNSPLIRLAQIVAVRAAPDILRREVFSISGKVLPIRNYKAYKALSVPLLRRFIEEEEARPAVNEYVYLHAIIPHTPFVWDGNCEEKSSDYAEQLVCATRLIKELVASLKRHGKYENSLIIVQSDHGYEGDSNAVNFRPGSDEAKAQILKHMSRISPESYFTRLNALLLVKPPAAPDAPMQVSESVSQLADVQATIVDLLKLPPEQTDGHSVFDTATLKGRAISVFCCVYQRNDKGRTVILGRNLYETDFAHLKYMPDGSWQVADEIRAKHEGW
ncbi:MAG: sulfatase-like hydrolase/transferase [Hyphomicrobiaceae bacterium]|nr:sulfatase-like hydrolase/transferase [Hyphomicrobiaceae bacterium]